MPEMMPESIEKEIQALIGVGEYRRALELLAGTYLDATYRYCFYMLNRDTGRARDVTQQVFEEACKGIGAYRGAASVKTWLLAIARNRCLKEMETQQRRKHLLRQHSEQVAARAHVEAPQESEAAVLSQQWLARLQEALDRLDPETRSMLIMRFGIGVSHEFSAVEIAQMLGLSRAAVYRKLQDALMCLRRIMHDDV